MDMKRAPKLETFYPEEDKWLISSAEVYDARMQITFVNNHLSTDVQIKYTFGTILFNNIIGMLILTAFATLVKQMYGILLKEVDCSHLVGQSLASPCGTRVFVLEHQGLVRLWAAEFLGVLLESLGGFVFL